MALRPDKNSTPEDQKEKRKAAEQDVFMREVDDALRQDEMSNFFKRFGIPVIAAIVVGLAALGGYLWWQHSKTESEGERGEQLIVAIDRVEAGNLDSAQEQLATIVADGSGTSVALAKLLQGGIAQQQDRTADAAKLFGEVAADAEVPEPFRDLATIREVSAQFDTLEPQAVVDKLKPLATPGSPWFGAAGELVGVAYLKQGKEDLAGPLFAQIARDENAPETLRSRARQMAGLLGVDAVDDPEELATGARAPGVGQLVEKKN